MNDKEKELYSFLYNPPLNITPSIPLSSSTKSQITSHVTNSFSSLQEFTCILFKNETINSKSQHACGHVFEKGEAIYRCKQCGQDETCVLCSTCFRSSNHENHDITFSIAVGSGGCCDCGDAEAWKTDIKCQLHPTSPSLSHSNYNSLPHELEREISETIGVVLDYILDVFDDSRMDFNTLASENEMCEKLECDGDFPKSFVCVLWNDESHSYDEVIRQIRQACQCSLEIAREFTESIDNFGRDVIKISSSYQEIIQVTRIISRIGLVVTIDFYSHVYREYVAGLLISWLKDLYTTLNGPIQIGNQVYEPVDGLYRRLLVQELCAPRRFVKKWLKNDWKDPCIEPVQESASSFDMTLDPDLNSPFKSTSRLQGLIESDCKFWKQVRNDIRQVFINTFIVGGEEEYKKIFGLCFARNYVYMAEQFLIKDREYESSIFNFAVQLFTTPTIAKYLVQNTNLLLTMFDFIKYFFLTDALPLEYKLSEISKYINGEIQASRSILYPRMKCETESLRNRRYWHLFLDIRYLISTEFVKKELFGEIHLDKFLDMILVFQGMHPQQRAIHTHVEYETEHWIHAINLAFQIEKIINHVSDCLDSTGNPERDWKHFLDCARATASRLVSWSCLEHIRESALVNSFESEIIGFHSSSLGYTIPKFKVSVQPVSLHYSCHWFFALLLSRIPILFSSYVSLESCDSDKFEWTQIFDTFTLSLHHQQQQELYSKDQSTLLNTLSLENRLLLVFEYPLRAVIMLAQIRAGMWVRNGYMMRSQAQHHRELMLRDSYDNNLFLVQTASCIFEPNLYLSVLMDRFELLPWMDWRPNTTSTDFEISQSTDVAEDFLQLLIYILSERSKVLGCSKEYEIHREIIHHLGSCSQGIAYSELTRRIPDSLVDCTFLRADGTLSTFDDVLKSVSNFKFPSGSRDHGVYELKEELYDSLDVWFYHLNRSQRSDLENCIKKLNEKLKRHKTVQLPRLLSLSPSSPFVSLIQMCNQPLFSRILFFSLWNTTKQKQDTGQSNCPSDMILSQALYLILLVLSESNNGVDVTSFFVNGTEIKFTIPIDMASDRIRPTSLLEWICSLVDRANEEDLKEHAYVLRFIINKFEESGLPEALQVIYGWRDKSKWDLKAPVVPLTDSSSVSEKDRKKQQAKARQAAIMAQFAQAQQSFIANYEEEMQEIEDVPEDQMESDQAYHMAPESMNAHVKTMEYPSGSCIVCQEDASMSDGRVYGILGSIQTSFVERRLDMIEICFMDFSLPFTCMSEYELDTQPAHELHFKGYPSVAEMYASSCGHLMHIHCFKTYLQSISARQASQPTRNHPENTRKQEFLCPLCKSLGNVIFPILEKEYSLYLDDADDTSSLEHARTRCEQDKTSLELWWKDKMSNVLENQTCIFTTEAPSTPTPTQTDAHGMSDRIKSILSSIWMLSPSSTNKEDAESAFQLHLIQPLDLLNMDTYSFTNCQSSDLKGLEVLWDVLSQTIQNIELMSRSPVQGRVLDGLHPQIASFLPVLASSIRSYAKLVTDKDKSVSESLNTCMLQTLQAIFYGKSFMESSSSSTQDIMPCLAQSSFRILGEVACSIHLVLGNDILDLYMWIKLFWRLELVKCVLLLIERVCCGKYLQVANISKLSHMDSNPKQEEQCPFVNWIMELIQVSDKNKVLFYTAFTKQDVKVFCESIGILYLRRCVLLLYAVSGVVDSNGKFGFNSDPTSSTPHPTLHPTDSSEFTSLLHHLKLSNIDSIFKEFQDPNSLMSWICPGWIQHFSCYYPCDLFKSSQRDFESILVPSKENGKHVLAFPQTLDVSPSDKLLSCDAPFIYELVALPKRFDELFESSRLQICKNCDSVPSYPALCLICGLYVCSQSFCCSQGPMGECNQHMQTCSGSIGLFLLVKKCIVLVLYEGKGHFMNSPYLDSHGEVDIGLKRGRPLFLNKKRYDEICRIWICQEIPSLVGRRIDSAFDLGGWSTF